MKITTAHVQLAALAVGVVVLVYAAKKGGAAVNAVQESVAGTPYEGHGGLGYLGAGFNWLLGGIPEKVGSAAGGWLYDAMH